MNIEKFEEILRWKYDKGVTSFIGNVSGNKYEIYRGTNPKTTRNYCVRINGKPIKVNTNFFAVACTIYDAEMEVCVGEM